MPLPDYGTQIMERLQANHNEIATLSINGSNQALTSYQVPESIIIGYSKLPAVYVTPPANVTITNTSAGQMDFVQDFEVTVIVQEISTSATATNNDGMQAYLDAEAAKWDFLAYYVAHPYLHTGSDRSNQLAFIPPESMVIPSLARVVTLIPNFQSEQSIAGTYAGVQIVLPITARYIVPDGESLF
jgi:hypothetical protein